MKCSFCGHQETKVTNKRESEKGTRRRRECLKCERRFTTYEKPEIGLVVIKKDGRREEYNREKLKLGLIKACEKRPVSREQIELAAGKIEEALQRKGGEINSKFIGEQVMNSLKKIDKVAYIRFASVYKEFKDVSDFKNAVKEVG